jgi:L-ascorbate metabolism protein UlaG (beta-lactamase superfamily)
MVSGAGKVPAHRSRCDDEEITVRVTKYTHACLRAETDGSVLVIDPGAYSEDVALDGADAVLITHEHIDHLDVGKLAAALQRRPELRIYTHEGVVGQLDALATAVTVVKVGETFDAAGFTVTAFGGIHAEIHRDIPRIGNLGYLVNGEFYHPGDSFAVPEGVDVPTLFVPVSAPWLRFAESVGFVRAVSPGQAIALHDALLSDIGLRIYSDNLQRLAGSPYRRLEPGQRV